MKVKSSLQVVPSKNKINPNNSTSPGPCFAHFHLTAEEFAIWQFACALVAQTEKAKQAGEPKRFFYISCAEVAARFEGLHEKTVQRWIRSLIFKGFLKVEEATKRGKSGWWIPPKLIPLSHEEYVQDQKSITDDRMDKEGWSKARREAHRANSCEEVLKRFVERQSKIRHQQITEDSTVPSNKNGGLTSPDQGLPSPSQGLYSPGRGLPSPSKSNVKSNGKAKENLNLEVEGASALSSGEQKGDAVASTTAPAIAPARTGDSPVPGNQGNPSARSVALGFHKAIQTDCSFAPVLQKLPGNWEEYWTNCIESLFQRGKSFTEIKFVAGLRYKVPLVQMVLSGGGALYLSNAMTNCIDWLQITQRRLVAMVTKLSINAEQMKQRTAQLDPLMALWSLLFPDEAIDKAQLGLWLSKYDPAVVEWSIRRTADARKKKLSQGVTMDLDYLVRYTATCARGKQTELDDARSKTPLGQIKQLLDAVNYNR